ncbi:MAG: family 16 glycosylhydrolase [Saprospiraceae bacterium]
MNYINYYTAFIITVLLGLTACEIENELPINEIRQAPKISVAAASVLEADENNTLDFEVALSWDYTQEVKVDYTTIAETAEEVLDFEASSGTITFAAGEVTKIVSIPVIGENIFENDETFKLELANPVNATILVGGAIGTIKNDDDINELVIPETGYTTPESYTGMELVWSDEFSAATLNTADWNYEIGRGNNGWGNNELQFYQEENTTIEEGHLVIEARKESFGGAEFTSSRLTTQGKEFFRFGRIDIRAVLPEGKGLWPALWMLGTKINAVGWPACGEIDIMELIGNQPSRVLGTCHYGANFANHRFKGSSAILPNGDKFSEEFHVFSLVWKENKMEWYIDDELFFEFDENGVGGQPYPFNDNFFFIFNVAVGGNLPGSPDGTTNFPQRMIVDYVRVFK